jgi:hypothetical protein
VNSKRKSGAQFAWKCSQIRSFSNADIISASIIPSNRTCISSFVSSSKANKFCPLCKQPVLTRDFVPEKSLGMLLNILKKHLNFDLLFRDALSATKNNENTGQRDAKRVLAIGDELTNPIPVKMQGREGRFCPVLLTNLSTKKKQFSLLAVPTETV